MTSGESATSSTALSADAAVLPRPADVDPHISADDPTRSCQTLLERGEPGLKFRIVRGCLHKYADTSLARPLRARGDGPRPPRHQGPR